SSSGADNTFTVVLATQPSDDVEVQLTRSGSGDVSVSPGSLDFTTTNWSTAQTVTLSAAEDDDAVDDEATISISTTGGDYAGLTAQVDVDVEDNDEIGITVQPSPVVVREGGASSRIRVALVTQPSAPVTLTLSQTGSINNDVEFDTDSTQTGSQSTLSFTTQNWAQQQPVEISAKDDTDSTDDTASILLSAQGGDYSGLTTTVRVDVTDDDRPNLVVSQGELTVDEGESTSFTVQLSTQPSASVTVGLTVPEGGEVTLDGDAVQSGVQGAVVFTDQNWNQARVVTVATLHDDDAVDDFHTLSLSVSSDSGPAEYRGASASVSLTVKDDEKPGISVTPASLEITEGSSKEFEVALTSQPPSSVVVTIAQAANAFIEFDTDADSQGSQSELRFNAENWSTGQTVTVTALQDVDSQDAEETLRLSSSGSGYNGYQAGVEVTVKDDDQPALELTRNNLAISDPVALDEGESATIGVRLVSRPSEAVVVSLSSSDADAVTVSPRTLDFTQGNWGVVQNFTVTGADDADSVDEEVQISLTTSGGNYEGRSASLQVTVDDDESAGLNISQTELTVVEGENKTLTVTLNNQPVGDVTVDLTTSSGAVTVSPVQLVFKEASWSGGLDVTVSGVDDHDRVDGEDVILLTASGGGYDRIVERVTVTVQDDDVAALKLSDEELNVPEGGSASFVVSLSVEPTDSVAVAIAGIDASAILCIPDRLSFTRENWTQPQVITVIGLQDDDTDDDDSPLNLVASGADYDGIRAQLAVTVVDQDEAVSEAEVEAAEGVLEEFGRTLLGSTVDVIARRFGALPGRAAADVGGAEVEVGGEGAFERALQGALRHFGGAAGAERGADDTADAADHLMRLGSIRLRDGRPLRLGQSATERRDPLLREFTYPLGGPGGETTAWMRFNRGEFSGEFRELGQGYDGSQDGIWVGIDQRFGNGVLFGAAVSENSGDAQYSIFSGGSSILMDTRLLMVMPYIEIPVRGGGMLSLILGSGGGEIDSLEADGSKSRAYLSVQMFSLGTKWPLTRLGRRISLSLTGSIGSSRLGTSCSTQIALCGLNSSGGRMSVGVELAHDEMQMSRNWKMTPRYAMSLRQDSGSQSKGGGMELSGSASMAAPGDRFSIDVGLRWLAMHATEAYEEWGGSVELQLRSRDEAGRGLSLGLGPQWGSSQSDVLQRRGAFGADPRELQRMRGEAGRAAMRASAGYGVDLWAGLLTPFAEYSVSGGEAASSRLQGGLRYRSGETLEGRLFGEWETGQGIQPQSRIGLELSRRF
ncbi:MAG: hypothetical protein ISN29_01580, partial [Gammaproteobacteria bacterium AqS3]|nr:hypothetical protein [Gammaproteobacteria bacterium AqS3]